MIPEKFTFNNCSWGKIGEGGEKRVYVHPENPNLVVAVFKKTVYSGECYLTLNQRRAATESIAYLNGILRFFYPDNVAKIFLSALTINNIPFYIQQRVFGRYPDQSRWQDRLRSGAMYGRLFDLCGWVDDYDTNSLIQDDGQEVFIDFNFTNTMNFEAINIWQKAQNLPIEERLTLLGYLNVLLRNKDIYMSEEPISRQVRQKHGGE